MLKITGTCHLSDDDSTDYSITFYLDASTIPLDQISISGKVSGVTLQFTGSYYITDLNIDSFTYSISILDDSTVIYPLDQDDDQDDIMVTLNDIRQLNASDWCNDVKIIIDTHWNCYCKYKNVCGCGCDSKHVGWTQ